ncbi:MAG: glutamine synthetase type III, partial [Bacillota bacterium]|nr:glutamine synthetase type III [Bacillota bacterium]
AVIKAVDEYQDLLRLSVATAGNDHRLGANEAPPAIISMFIGDDLSAVLESIVNDSPYNQKDKTVIKVGVNMLPHFFKDTTDRNRTSPFAFTGNKFEFRMPGSSLSIAGPNFVLNTIVAEALSQFADALEKAPDFTSALDELIKSTISEHKRIIFNGNNYSEDWVKEAEKRGLLNLKTTVDAMPYFISEKNISLFKKHGILTESEIRSRYEIMLDGYCKTLNIEALTMLEMIKRNIIPSACAYIGDLSETAIRKKEVLPDVSCAVEKSLIEKLSSLTEILYKKTEKLELDLLGTKDFDDIAKQSAYYKEVVLLSMQELRAVADELEPLVGEKYWPFPTYSELLFNI